MKLFCAIVGVAGSAFDVDIDKGVTVSALKDAIKARNEDIKTPVRQLRLFLARKTKKWASDVEEEKGGDEEKWLTQREAQKGVSDISGYSWLEYPDAKLQAVGLAIDQLGEVSDEDVAVGLGHVHVLVVVPEQEQPRLRLWRVSASIESIRSRLYRLLGVYLGYYDPARCTDDKDIALWYEDETLCVQSLFKTEENALMFDNTLRQESVTSSSPLNGHDVRTDLDSISSEYGELHRIFASHSDPKDTVSPQVSLASLASITSLIEVATDEFKYQHIESERCFGPLGMAQSCHVMSREHCRGVSNLQKV
ncbi:hypothetical protein V7S43_010098 [Phytophthora oleae]|uniref:Crinkler effector protein N-terminal domain-containing protein n=1 Tax=Phytophthora oleae TaxID=2107226 RepID=A0ABD3FF72_9STRA